MKAVARLVAANVRSANSDSGTSGAEFRFSTRTNTAESARPTAPTATTGGLQPSRPAVVRAYVTALRAPTTQAAPRTSSRPALSRLPDSGTCRTAMTTTATATGTFTRNTQRQFSVTSQPPRNGPIAAATPPSPDQAPIARARSPWAKLAEMMARLPGVSRAPPTPCSARAAIRTPAVGASAQPIDASPNQIVPITNT